MDGDNREIFLGVVVFVFVFKPFWVVMTVSVLRALTS